MVKIRLWPKKKPSGKKGKRSLKKGKKKCTGKKLELRKKEPRPGCGDPKLPAWGVFYYAKRGRGVPWPL